MESEGEGGGYERRAVVQEVMAAILILALAVGWLAVSVPPRNLLVLLAGSASAARKMARQSAQAFPSYQGTSTSAIAQCIQSAFDAVVGNNRGLLPKIRHGLWKTPAVALCGPVAVELVVTGRADRSRCGKTVR